MKKRIAVYTIIAGGAFGLGWYSKPIQIRTETKVVEVIKEVKSQKQVVTEKPDGTKVTVTETLTETNTGRSTDSKSTKVEGIPSVWSIGVYKGLGDAERYVGTLDRKILGNLAIGLYVRLNGNLEPESGLGLRYDF